MPRPILNIKSQTHSKSDELLSATMKQENKRSTQIDQMKLNRLLRKKRSQKYMQVLHQLDAGGHVCNRQQIAGIIKSIQEEFPEIELQENMIGIVAKCYLGSPYEVHTLDIAGQIVVHYKTGESLPNGLEAAHSLAMFGSYEYIEVYKSSLRAISEDGSVSVIKI